MWYLINAEHDAIQISKSARSRLIAPLIAITGDISRNFQETPFVNKILVLLLHLDDKPSYHSLTPDCLKHFSVHPSWKKMLCLYFVPVNKSIVGNETLFQFYFTFCHTIYASGKKEQPKGAIFSGTWMNSFAYCIMHNNAHNTK